MINAIPSPLTSYIDGSWVEGSRDPVLAPDVNPANTDDVLTQIHGAGVRNVQAALAAARKAFLSWSSLPAPARATVLFQAADLMSRELDPLAHMLTREEGKTLREAKAEIDASVMLLRYYAGQVLATEGDVIPSQRGDVFIHTLRESVGVVVAITPWNFPVSTPIGKIAPALAAGNAVIWKPSTLTPMCAAMIAMIFQRVGLPAGALNVVFGSGEHVGKALLSEGVDAISFTGSTDVGLQLQVVAAKKRIAVQCEMGGSNAIIVLGDADLEQAADIVAAGAFASTGQKCSAARRCIVHESVVEEFRRLLLERSDRLRVGDGMEAETDIGPVISGEQLAKNLEAVHVAQASGAKVLIGGRQLEGVPHNKGFYLGPTVISGLDHRATLAQQEIFGPVLILLTCSDLNEAAEIANSTRYGLSASICTRDMRAAMRFARLSATGIVKINEPPSGLEPQAPIGGRKDSGVGPREWGAEGLDLYTRAKTIYVNFQH